MTTSQLFNAVTPRTCSNGVALQGSPHLGFQVSIAVATITSCNTGHYVDRPHLRKLEHNMSE